MDWKTALLNDLKLTWGDMTLGTLKTWVAGVGGVAVYGGWHTVGPYLQKLVHTIVGG